MHGVKKKKKKKIYSTLFASLAGYVYTLNKCACG